MMITGVECTGGESLLGDCHIEDLNHWKECTSQTAVQIKCARGDFVLDAAEPMRFMKQRMNTIIVEVESDGSESAPSPPTRSSFKQTSGIQNEEPVGSRVS